MSGVCGVAYKCDITGCSAEMFVPSQRDDRACPGNTTKAVYVNQGFPEGWACRPKVGERPEETFMICPAHIMESVVQGSEGSAGR